MKSETDITALRQPESVNDPLTEIARYGARQMLAAALRAEVAAFVAQHAEETLPNGWQRVVRHGYWPERNIRTGIGAHDAPRLKVRDRAAAPDDDKVRFSSPSCPNECGGRAPALRRKPRRLIRSLHPDSGIAPGH